MDLARRVYSRELKIAAMREIDHGRTMAEVARQLQLSPKLLERWRSEWAARGELAFPGIGRRSVPTGLSELRQIAELERKIGQLTMENDFLKKGLQHFRELHPPAVVNGEAACSRKSGKRPSKAKP
jgi:transposase-like protein